MRRFLALLAPLLLSASLGRADDAQLIRALGGDTHAAREAAEQALWRRADEALPALRAAAATDDPEVALRASRLVRLLENGIYADTPPETAEKLRKLPSLSLEEMTRTVATNLADRTLGPRLLRRAVAASRQRDEAPLFAALLRPALREPLLRLVAEGRETDAADLLLLAARGGLDAFATPAADAAWLCGGLDRLEARLREAAPEPGDAPVRAIAAFHRGEHAAAAALAREKGPAALAAMCAALTGDWSRLDDLPWWGEIQWRSALDTSALARARLRGDPAATRAAVEEAITFAKETPDDQWYALEILLVNDAWPALPAFFAATSNALLEADYAYEFFQPDHFARVASNAWAEADNPNLRYRLLTWSRALTGADPVPNRSEVRVAEQFGRPTTRARDTGEETPDWEAFRDQLTAQNRQSPFSTGTQLLLGWAESQLGHAEAAETWRRRAGWNLILRGDFDPARLNQTLFENPGDPYWARTVDMIHHLRRYEPDFLPFLEATFARALQTPAALTECIGWLELGRLRFLSPARSYTGLQGYLFHARRLAELHIHFALARGDAPAATALATAHLDILLHESAEIHGRLAAHPAFAADFARLAFDRMAGRLQAFPLAVEMRNNAAWLAAVSRQRLPEALALLAPAGADAPVHTLDTRAELLFQLGRADEALALAGANATAAPTDPYFARQLDRMKRGDRASLPR